MAPCNAPSPCGLNSGTSIASFIREVNKACLTAHDSEFIKLCEQPDNADIYWYHGGLRLQDGKSKQVKRMKRQN